MNGDGAVDEAHGQPQAAVVPSAADGTLLQCRQLPLHPSLTGGGTPKAKENSAFMRMKNCVDSRTNSVFAFRVRDLSEYK
ncbi:hypothetical protein GW17_00019463 [Ensete ventricosum]|nr:hypothetical protein GW17_00019463 [Ensete ventricosum]